MREDISFYLDMPYKDGCDSFKKVLADVLNIQLPSLEFLRAVFYVCVKFFSTLLKAHYFQRSLFVRLLSATALSLIKRSNRHQRRATPTLHLLFPKTIHVDSDSDAKVRSKAESDQDQNQEQRD